MRPTLFSDYDSPGNELNSFGSQKISYEKLLEAKLTTLLKQSLVFCEKGGTVNMRLVDQTRGLIETIEEALPGLEIRMRDDVMEFFDRFGE